MRTSLLLVATLLAACRGSARPGTDTTPVADRAGLTRLITAQLERAADDWNRGDLEGFLSDYAAESTTTYVDGRRARAGIDFIRSTYAPRFSPGADRGRLHFEEIQVRPLSGDSRAGDGPLHSSTQIRNQLGRPIHSGHGAQGHGMEDPPRPLLQ